MRIRSSAPASKKGSRRAVSPGAAIVFAVWFAAIGMVLALWLAAAQGFAGTIGEFDRRIVLAGCGVPSTPAAHATFQGGSAFAGVGDSHQSSLSWSIVSEHCDVESLEGF